MDNTDEETRKLPPIEQLKLLRLELGAREAGGLWLHGEAKDVERAAELFAQMGYKKNTSSERLDFSEVNFIDSCTARIKVYNAQSQKAKGGLVDFVEEHGVAEPAARIATSGPSNGIAR